jgi:hypothetical protein
VKLCVVNGGTSYCVENRGCDCTIGRSLHLNAGVKIGGTLYPTRRNYTLLITEVFPGPSFKNRNKLIEISELEIAKNKKQKTKLKNRES